MSGKRVKQLRKYLKETCKIHQDLDLLEDSRKDPTYSTTQMSGSMLLAFLCRTSSIRQVERRLRRKGWRRFVGLPTTGGSPVEGTFRYFFSKLETDTVRQALVQSVKRMVRAKMVTSPFNSLYVATVDGTQQFSTKERSCNGCIERRSKKKKEGEPSIWYEHKIVNGRLLGESFRPWLGFVTQHTVSPYPNRTYEGEQTAILRLLDQFASDYGKMLDAIITDSLHASRPFIEKCEEHDWWAIFVAKENAKSIHSNFASLPLPEPVYAEARVKEGLAEATIWEQENIYLNSCDIPLRVLKIEQKITEMNGKVKRHEIRWIATTLPKEILDATDLWCLAWRRWEIETGGHRTIKREHHSETPFCHKDLTSVENVLWLLMWGQNLLEAFGFRRLQSGRFGGLKDGLIGLVEELIEQLAVNPYRESWEVPASLQPG